MSSQSQIDRDAELVYNYHRMGMTPRPASAVFCLCSLDTRVATRAAQLFLDGYGGYLIYSGGTGKLTQGRFSEPEAEVFARIAREMGVPEDKIVVESKSTNTGENVRFVHALLRERGLEADSFVLVQKPYMERRTYATFRKQWPDRQTGFTVASPELGFREYPDADNPKDLVIQIMVGDLVRIKSYPERGFQIAQEIPEEVWEANQRLVAAGYDGYLP
ncbi:Uncharacterized protein C8034_v006026 [Colletotrichum sidae]|uniref:DUF218 domain-containing protein n=1 Tax=Colletotrichum sidae TaxID=1347389 RepID=A0A4V3I209_9PEZI|nr:Uncharacterized protein C8034_v006026 [Colletotrichum sidae]